MHVLSISALKGGVGKTTITLGLASAAMKRGLKTLVIDLDPQANASHGLGLINDYKFSAAEVIKKPKFAVIEKAILASLWAKGQIGRLDVMVGQSRLYQQNIPNPSFKKLWNLEQALSKVEKDYDLVIIDTPPNMNSLTRLAWVASDRVMLVTEPSINSLVAVENGLKALTEIRKQVNRQVSLFGIVINRLRPTLAEHQYRVNELEELYGDRVSEIHFEEKSPLAQAQGAGRSIHSWPGQAAAKLAAGFDQLLEEVVQSFAYEDLRRLEQPKSSRDRNRYAHRSKPEPSSAKPHGRRSAEKSETAKPERIEMIDSTPVSDEYKEKFTEALRQTMTEKQRKAFEENSED